MIEPLIEANFFNYSEALYDLTLRSSKSERDFDLIF